MGRPMRINAHDYDIPYPLVDDVFEDFNLAPLFIQSKYLPSDFLQLAEHWVVLLQLSEMLGRISRATMNG